MTRPRLVYFCVLAALAAASRVVPHPPNVSPMTALALFAGATFGRRWVSALVPLAAMLLGDSLLQLTYNAGLQPGWGFYRGQWVIYACMLATVGVGLLIHKRGLFPSVLVGSLSASVMFFLVTNCVLLHIDESPYPITVGGQLLSYWAALPFFRNALLGDLAFSAVMFGGLAFAESRLGRPVASETLAEPAAVEAV